MICLIIPPAPFLVDQRVFPNLGVLKVAASHADVTVLDLSGVDDYEEAVRKQLMSREFDWVGITATTPQMPLAARIASIVREAEVKVMLGGPHATLTNAAYKATKSARAQRALQALLNTFDVVVAGDGEWLKVENVIGLVDVDDGLPCADLRPARHLIDLVSYKYTIDGVPATSIMSQQGCPFNCGFCGGRASPSFRRLRTNPLSSTFAEIEQLYRTYGFRGFMFYDDELNVDNRRFMELLAGLRTLANKLGTQFSFRGFVKAELFTSEQAVAMYQAGFRWVLIGFESGSDRILRNMGKRATVKDNTGCVDIAHSAELKVKALMSVGHPGESLDTLRETYNWLLQVQPDDFDVTVIAVYPGSPYYDHAVESDAGWAYTAPSGDKLYMREVDYLTTSDYYKGHAGEYVANIHTDHLQSDVIIRERDIIEANVRATLSR